MVWKYGKYVSMYVSIMRSKRDLDRSGSASAWPHFNLVLWICGSVVSESLGIWWLVVAVVRYLVDLVDAE